MSVRTPSLEDVSIEFVTPALAREWLARNENNRLPKEGKIDSYVRDMLSGAWVYNGAPIRFSDEGVLLDGQNRLFAIIRAGYSAYFLVVRGISAVAQATMDTGVKRTFADTLKMNNYKLYSEKASVTGLLHRYLESGGKMAGSVSTRAFSVSELQRTFDLNPWIETDAEDWSRVARKTPLAASLAGVSWGVLTGIDRGDAEEFFGQLCRDTDHVDGSPILALRRALQNFESSAPGSSASTRIKLAMVFKAWNKYRNGESAKLIGWRPGGANPEPFPIPV